MVYISICYSVYIYIYYIFFFSYQINDMFHDVFHWKAVPKEAIPLRPLLKHWNADKPLEHQPMRADRMLWASALEELCCASRCSTMSSITFL